MNPVRPLPWSRPKMARPSVPQLSSARRPGDVGLDLNLLLPLDALLQERSVTRAAERLGLVEIAADVRLG